MGVCFQRSLTVPRAGGQSWVRDGWGFIFPAVPFDLHCSLSTEWLSLKISSSIGIKTNKASLLSSDNAQGLIHRVKVEALAASLCWHTQLQCVGTWVTDPLQAQLRCGCKVTGAQQLLKIGYHQSVKGPRWLICLFFLIFSIWLDFLSLIAKLFSEYSKVLIDTWYWYQWEHAHHWSSC